MTIKVLQTISPNIKLTLDGNKKSPQGRTKEAAKLSRGFQELIRQVPQNELTIDKYREMVYSLIPSIKPPIEVVQITEPTFAGTLQTSLSAENKNNCIQVLYNGYRVKLNLDGNNIVSDKSIIVHETRHLFDSICTPKKNIMRCVEYAHNIELANKMSDTIAFFKHPGNPLNKKVLNEKLAGFNPEIIVGILQQSRHSIQSEVNAYKDEFLFLLKQHSPIEKIFYRLLGKFEPLDAMRSKLKIITKELKKILRSRHSF